MFHVIHVDGGHFNEGEVSLDLKCEEKERLRSEKFTIDVIGASRTSRQSFTKLVSMDLSQMIHVKRTLQDDTPHHWQHRLGSVRPFLVSGRFNILEQELDEKKDRMKEI